MNIAHNESPKILTIIPHDYRARCTQARCRNLGRVILRHFDGGGRPDGQCGILQRTCAGEE